MFKKLAFFTLFLVFILFTVALISALGRPLALEHIINGVDAWKAFDRAATVLGFFGSLLVFYGLLVSTVLNIFKPGWWHRFLPRRNRFFDAENEKIVAHTDALVLLAGTNVGLTKELVTKLKPKIVAIIGTGQTDLLAAKATLDAGIEVEEMLVVSSPNSATETKRRAEAVIARLKSRFGSARVVCDITGTTKPMTIGLFMAAEEAGVPSVYCSSERDAKGKVIEGTEIMRYVSMGRSDA